jgi:hypothetical protein
MPDKTIVKRSLIHSALAALYVAVVATFMQNASKIFGPDEPASVVAPITFLLVFVVSAATMGALIFGKPVMLYMDGKRREAVQMMVCTIASLAIITVLLIVTMAASRA